MKLYYSPGACGLSPQIALREVGAQFQLIKVDLRSKQSEEGDFYKVNPKGYIPYLALDSGEGFSEAAVILQVISDQHPEKGLFPIWGQRERYHAMETLNFIGTELHKGIGILFAAGLNEETKDILRARLTPRFAYLNQKLGENPWLLGKQFSIADAYLYNMYRWTKPTRINLGDYKNLLGWVERTQERPSVIASVEAEGLKV